MDSITKNELHRVATTDIYFLDVVSQDAHSRPKDVWVKTRSLGL